MANLGTVKVTVIGARVASAPTFIPSQVDPKRNHTMVTAIVNRGTNPRTQEEMSDSYTLNFWGKYANFASKYLTVGREINIDGELRSYSFQTGQVKNGKPEIGRRVEILVNGCYFGKDSKKELVARINENLNALRLAGRLPATVNITAEELIAIHRTDPGDYNPAIHDATGMYGAGRIWKKGIGFVAGNAGAAAAPVTTGQPVTTGTAGAATAPTMEQLQATIADLTAKVASAGAGAAEGTVNPFTGAQ